MEPKEAAAKAVPADSTVVGQSGRTYGQLRNCLTEMEAAVKIFYTLARNTRNHAFIEFTGILGEYVKICRASLEQGIDFCDASVHTGVPLKVSYFNKRYLAEKLECIYGAGVPEFAEFLEKMENAPVE